MFIFIAVGIVLFIITLLASAIGMMNYNESRRREVRAGHAAVPSPTGGGTKKWLGQGAEKAKAIFKKGASAIATLVVLCVVYYILWHQYPGYMGLYEANGGPTWLLVLIAITIAFVSTTASGMLRKGSVWALCILALVIVLPPALQAKRLLSAGNEIAGGNERIAPLPSNLIDVGLTPVDITDGGTRPATWNFVNRGDCINIYDGDMHFLGENCEGRGEFFDLREQGQIYISASRSENVELTYNTW